MISLGTQSCPMDPLKGLLLQGRPRVDMILYGVYELQANVLAQGANRDFWAIQPCRVMKS